MYLAPFRQRETRRPTVIFPRQLVAAGRFLSEIEAGLPRIREKPALILWGDRDFAFKQVERGQFCAAFPNHRSITLSGAGHFIHEDAPGRSATRSRPGTPTISVPAPPNTTVTHGTNLEETHV